MREKFTPRQYRSRKDLGPPSPTNRFRTKPQSPYNRRRKLHENIPTPLPQRLRLRTYRGVDGKICPSLDIRNHPGRWRSCATVPLSWATFHVVLIDNVTNSSVYEKYSFPQLTEIADHLLVFRLAWLPSLGDLFPNLRVIRGNQLFLNFAIVVYRMPHLQEVCCCVVVVLVVVLCSHAVVQRRVLDASSR
ncbi:hypothetical protein GEV33_010769 [Tenebrio molitor]|uniref:Receptor L-domain domain-containing protein n=1 Tax=Tenebrio molitor TaxID=7067 RepID=A0A8J6H541_TENMO|nr:hypothetical protein GEV33_010769 [Tenebrio molitor]